MIMIIISKWKGIVGASVRPRSSKHRTHWIIPDAWLLEVMKRVVVERVQVLRPSYYHSIYRVLLGLLESISILPQKTIAIVIIIPIFKNIRIRSQRNNCRSFSIRNNFSNELMVVVFIEIEQTLEG